MRAWVAVFLLGIPITGYSLDATTFFKALKTQDIECVLNTIEINSSTTPQQVLHFLESIKEICEVNYNISISLFQLEQDILDICKNTISDLDCLYQVEIFLNELVYPDTINIFSQFILLICDTGQGNIFQNKDIPIGVILGCVEIGCGALLWATPFRTIGNILIGDGYRRMLNEVEVRAKIQNSTYRADYESAITYHSESKRIYQNTVL